MNEVAAAKGLENIRKDVEDGSAYCYGKVLVWAPIYYVSRSALIIFSALTSAEAITTIAFIKGGQPFFALLVTLITGFDVWLKPGTKYHALFTANDEYLELRQRIDLTSPTDAAEVKSIHEEYKAINARIRDLVTPS